MKQLPSIRHRLVGAVLAVSAAWGLAVSAVVWFTVQHEVDELLDGTLQESAEVLFGLLNYHAARLPLDGSGSLPAPVHDEQLVWQIVNASGQVLLRSHRAPATALAAPRLLGLSGKGSAWRVFALAFDAEGRVLQVAQGSTERREARLAAAAITAGGALLVGMLCALGLSQLVRRETQPITDFSAAVGSYDPITTGAALAAPLRAELLPMQGAVADLGTRVARHIANERAFAAHAAHALRTPLAGMVAQLAAAQQRGNAEVQPFLTRTRGAANRLSQVVAALLTLFRAGTQARPRPLALDALVGHLPINGLQVHVGGPEGAVLVVDEDLVAAALMNLLDNAQRHGATQAWVTARRSSLAAGTGVLQHLTVRDDGPGVSEEQRVRLQQALDSQNYQGQMGLGLMLADLVCRAHGGRLQLLDPAATSQGHAGFMADLQIPEAPG